ncbi:MAG: D-alanine--D-alanine ligase [Chloroflexi bacterium]|nr:D-alanine--D-alanine ligase [Chloroflexota bacterium]
MQRHRLRVGVIYGGRSGEHEVSIQSARSVLAAIDPERYEAVPIGITQEGSWHAVEPDALLAGGASDRSRLLPSADPRERGLARTERSDGAPEPFDVAFPLVHGTFGEDGCIQGLLELASVPYVGSSVLGSAVGMDKILMKRVFAASGIPVVPWVEVSRFDWERQPSTVADRVANSVGYPCFAKPANLGSSVGISKVTSGDGLAAALDVAAEFSSRIIVERGVNARELECGVLGNDEPEASVVGEVVVAREFYDYVAKYEDERTRLRIPADIPEGIAERIRCLAVDGFRAIGANGMARVDFLWSQTDGELYVSEINTIPGFTPMSAYPRLWAASGVTYPELIDRLITLAIERHTDQSRNRTRFRDSGEAAARPVGPAGDSPS